MVRWRVWCLSLRELRQDHQSHLAWPARIVRRERINQRVAEHAVVGEAVVAQVRLAPEAQSLRHGGAACVACVAANEDALRSVRRERVVSQQLDGLRDAAVPLAPLAEPAADLETGRAATAGVQSAGTH